MSHSAIPFPRFGTEGLSDAGRAKVEHSIRVLKNMCEVRGLRYYVQQVILTEGDGRAFKLTFIWNHDKYKAVVEPAESKEEQPTGKATAEVPHFFTAEVTRMAPFPGEGVKLALSNQCRRRLEGYTGALAPAHLELQRFVIEYPQHLAEFPHESTARTITQFAQARATWWSGRMAAVVQAAMGYGRQDFEALPQPPQDEEQAQAPSAARYEQADKMALPEATVQAIGVALGLDEEGKGGAMLPACNGTPPKTGQIQFDYKVNCSDGVVFGSDRTPWLVRIRPSGVFAMPLPMVPATRTPAFRQYIEDVGDAEILWLLDTFGGMPSGEGFPATEKEFAAWHRAGVIFKMGDAGGFYSGGSYSQQVGWSFNHAGTMAVNTCWKWGDKGLKRGQAWALGFFIGALDDYGMAREKKDSDLEGRVTGAHRSVVLQYISMVEQAAAAAVQEGDALKKAALYAFRRAPVDDILGRAIQPDVKAAEELEYWSSYEARPIAAGWVRASLMGEGTLYSHEKPRAQPQIKFPVVEAGGCISFDFSREELTPKPSPDPKCDTIMHAYFVGDDLKVVKYFRDVSEIAPRVERDWDDGEELAVGSWTETVTLSPERLMGSFYTTDFDERRWASEKSRVTKTVGKDLGYDAVPFFAFYTMFDMRGDIWRNRYAQHDSNTAESAHYDAQTAICVPYFAPHGALHAWRETDNGIELTQARKVLAFRDPHSYKFWTYHSVFAWYGGLPKGQTYTYEGEFVPSPYEKREGHPVWVNGYNYDMYGSDFADQGDWMGTLPQDVTWLVRPNSTDWNLNGGGSPPTTKQFVRTSDAPDVKNGKVDISYAPQPQNVHKDMPDSWYFTMSPDPDGGGVFYRDASRNEAGNVDYCNCSELRADGIRYSWGRNEVADSRAAHHFIGVFAQ